MLSLCIACILLAAPSCEAFAVYAPLGDPTGKRGAAEEGAPFFNLAGPGNFHCASEKRTITVFEGSSLGWEDCQTKCTRHPFCIFYSIWPEPDHWCLLTRECERLQVKENVTGISIYARKSQPKAEYVISRARKAAQRAAAARATEDAVEHMEADKTKVVARKAARAAKQAALLDVEDNSTASVATSPAAGTTANATPARAEQEEATQHLRRELEEAAANEREAEESRARARAEVEWEKLRLKKEELLKTQAGADFVRALEEAEEERLQAEEEAVTRNLQGEAEEASQQLQRGPEEERVARERVAAATRMLEESQAKLREHIDRQKMKEQIRWQEQAGADFVTADFVRALEEKERERLQTEALEAKAEEAAQQLQQELDDGRLASERIVAATKTLEESQAKMKELIDRQQTPRKKEELLKTLGVSAEDFAKAFEEEERERLSAEDFAKAFEEEERERLLTEAEERERLLTEAGAYYVPPLEEKGRERLQTEAVQAEVPEPKNGTLKSKRQQNVLVVSGDDLFAPKELTLSTPAPTQDPTPVPTPDPLAGIKKVAKASKNALEAGMDWTRRKPREAKKAKKALNTSTDWIRKQARKRWKAK